MSKTKIGIIDADLLDHGTRHPNLALEKISGYMKAQNHQVTYTGGKPTPSGVGWIAHT